MRGAAQRSFAAPSAALLVTDGVPRNTTRPGAWSGISLEKPVDHQPAEAVPNQMQPFGAELCHELREPRGHVFHARGHGGIAKGVHAAADVAFQAAAQYDRFVATQP